MCVISNANALCWLGQVQVPCLEPVSKVIFGRVIHIHGQCITSEGKDGPYITPGLDSCAGYKRC